MEELGALLLAPPSTDSASRIDAAADAELGIAGATAYSAAWCHRTAGDGRRAGDRTVALLERNQAAEAPHGPRADSFAGGRATRPMRRDSWPIGGIGVIQISGGGLRVG